MEELTKLYRRLYDGGHFLFDGAFAFSDESVKSSVVEVGGDYGVFLDSGRVDGAAEEAELIAHECGHIETGTTHAVYSPFELVAQHENRANKWAVHELLPREELQRAIRAGCTEPWELAEFLGRTEQFIRLAVQIYEKEKTPEAVN
ncbi:ImmA/IrrE family metallo-endopeptidase [Butyricicoccus faecihominis]|uniref:ImmA/IrrE family metallo-endopeptidase n=1 Tax=Butyricicoccaceae TaxID=3085642 RepID=UPI00247ABF18|nr:MULTISPECIES: ImmA/IrrE family metallo-endopeptidase [Butyricicoccaceae]MCQ5129570.1 ImmA/IrrE family metallo-endopeptidase [Butyricicoccus faecihominis]WNX83928.1 ImmA/IrrE family metallo-endopeptidase [Agathobaculum sp. NTUH-O15-33]